MKKVCDEIFGVDNFIANVVWERAYSPVNLKKHFSENHDYAICYAKNKDYVICNGLKRNDEVNNRYSNPDNDPRGVWQSDNFSVGPAVESNIYEVITPSGRTVLPPSGRSWLLNKNRFEEFLADNRIWFGENGGNVPRIKRFLSETKQTMTPMTIWKYEDVGHSQSASQDLKRLFDGKALFDYPKPVNFIKRMLELYSNSNDLILDFFSGSGTTAHAVMQLNAEDNGKRKFICVQLPEKTDEKSEAFKVGYSTIAEITKERIRRSGSQILQNLDEDKPLDVGFRVLKIDSSNMKDIYYQPEQYDKTMLDQMVSHIKEDRTAEDLLFQVMLDWGIELSLPIKRKTIDGSEVYFVAGNTLVACFDKFTMNVVDEIAKVKPLRVVSTELAIMHDQDKTNIKERFKQLSSDTEVRFL